ncbi:type III-B CRISPR module-associated protein Cmr5 [Methylobacter tundripaludum]|uniref:CRISPR type III-B/RAMP module-associated protein Cmr5 n=1 Tax=Methylobacter tundripaludum (strain ATCC BAA-1195 / DSM 17260 / SV96) TaxID=697282 RepID=G3IV67_METTV|nr:type III-B CRISPR module-associated protein Cmr5 [Methylobacter tundripaludum]EGW21680.1 CRISPR-associated protein, Cmr5 family [Methylobacter tundripaludum SV96]
MSRTLEQRRAAFTLAFIKGQLSLEEKDKDKLSTHIHKSPSLILQCGLGQALAFLLADAGDKPKAPSKILYNSLQDWLCGEPDEKHPMRVYQKTELIEALVTGTRSDYFRAQEESLMLFNWLKKFAAAKL